MQKLLSITNLKKYFPMPKASVFSKQVYNRANEDITLNIYKGETFGLVGESGCGKSTLGRVLLQLYEQTAGSTMYYGRTLDTVAPEYVIDTLKNAEKYVAEYHLQKSATKRAMPQRSLTCKTRILRLATPKPRLTMFPKFSADSPSVTRKKARICFFRSTV